MSTAKKAIRNISGTGRKNMLYGGLSLIALGFIFSIFGISSEYTLLSLSIFAIFTSGCLVLLESTTQVCVYHGFLGTHESSLGGKRHEDESVARACRTRSWWIILQSLIGGLILTLIMIFFLR